VLTRLFGFDNEASHSSAGMNHPYLVGGVLFICMQQIVILDFSYAWNDSWVEKSNRADLNESGSGKKWLAAILLFCAIFLFGTFSALLYMFMEFTGCTTNNLFISLTLIFCVLMLIAQMTGGEGSLLSVSCISAWATYLCFTAVTKNPDATCNPRFGESSPLSIAFGLIMTVLSLGWAGWSYTAEDKFTDVKASTTSNEDHSFVESNLVEGIEPDGTKPKRSIAGVVTQSGAEDSVAVEEGAANHLDENPNNQVNTEDPSPSSNAWKLNVALVVVSCWSAMTMTQWGIVQSNDGTIANRSIGRVGMWVIIGSQWFVMTLYLWTLVAPRIFPNRDFS
jgi:serine incorporator 1/3